MSRHLLEDRVGFGNGNPLVGAAGPTGERTAGGAPTLPCPLRAAVRAELAQLRRTPWLLGRQPALQALLARRWRCRTVRHLAAAVLGAGLSWLLVGSW